MYDGVRVCQRVCGSEGSGDSRVRAQCCGCGWVTALVSGCVLCGCCVALRRLRYAVCAVVREAARRAGWLARISSHRRQRGCRSQQHFRTAQACSTQSDIPKQTKFHQTKRSNHFQLAASARLATSQPIMVGPATFPLLIPRPSDGRAQRLPLTRSATTHHCCHHAALVGGLLCRESAASAATG